jgi:hypothetical protein
MFASRKAARRRILGRLLMSPRSTRLGAAPLWLLPALPACA